MDIVKKINRVNSQQDLAEFVEYLRETHGNLPDWWKNHDLPAFLEALSAWIEDMDGYYKNKNIPYDENNISWKNIADMLYAASIYE